MDRVLEKKRFTPKNIALYGAVAVLTTLGIYSIAARDAGTKLNVGAETITIATVEQADFQEFIPITGNVMPLKTVFLDAVEGGQVEQKFVEEGAYVNAGDVIVKLGNTNLVLDIMQREAQVFEQLNNARNTRLSMEQNRLALASQILELDYKIAQQKADYDRNLQLAGKDLISKSEIERLKSDYDYLVQKRRLTIETHKQDSIFRAAQIRQLDESVNRMQMNLAVVKRKMDNLLLKAPVSGQLSALNAEIGELKSAGVQLGQIDMTGGFKIRASVDEHYLTRTFPGQDGRCTIDGKNYELKVLKTYPQVQGGKFDVDMEFSGAIPPDLRRGQTIYIRLELGQNEQAMLIPRGGFYQATGGNWIYVVDKDGSSAHKREIKLGRQNPDKIEVLEGLQRGEKVITSSYETFSDKDVLVLKK
jgi:HlyD family secretion protein